MCEGSYTVINSATAQDLKAAVTTAQSDFNPIWLLVGLAVALVLFYELYWKPRHPTGAATVSAAAHDALATAHQALTAAAATLAEVVKHQSAVIASPPVQAAINAPPALGPAPVTPASIAPLPQWAIDAQTAQNLRGKQ
jgi:hypothetical protein